MCVSEFQNDDRYCPGLLLGVKETHRGNVNAPVCVSEFVPPPIDKNPEGSRAKPVSTNARIAGESPRTFSRFVRARPKGYVIMKVVAFEMRVVSPEVAGWKFLDFRPLGVHTKCGGGGKITQFVWTVARFVLSHRRATFFLNSPYFYSRSGEWWPFREEKSAAAGAKMAQKPPLLRR